MNLPTTGRRLLLLFRWEFLRGAFKALHSDPQSFADFPVLGHRVRMRPPSYLGQYPAIVLERVYDFEAETDAPRILDLGANVGMSCVFFKSSYPKSRIVAFEADPELTTVLRENLARAGLEDVEVVPLAAWTENGTASFHPDGLGGGRIAERASEAPGFEVPTVDLREWLRDRPPFDLVKVDLEGAENTLLPYAIEELSRSSRLAFEYHSVRGEEQQLGELLTTLKRAGFRYHVQSEGVVLSPFRNCLPGRYDNRLMIHATPDRR